VRRSSQLVLVAVTAALLAVSPAAPGSAEPEAAPATQVARPLLPLVRLSAERLLLADKVAAAKWGTGQPIDDPAREQQILDYVARRSVELGIDPVVAQRIFRDQIEAGKIVQRGLFQSWAADPGRQPTQRPDLSREVRPVLDRITNELLDQIKDTAPVRARPSCEGRLIGAYGRVGREDRLDGLHWAGLARALPDVCAPDKVAPEDSANLR
jgi:chorismate mutase